MQKRRRLSRRRPSKLSDSGAEDYAAELSRSLEEIAKRVAVVLVEPKHQGNIGAVARSMENFGLSSLRIISGETIQDEAFARSMNGRHILEAAEFFDSLSDAVGDFQVIAGTSSTSTTDDRKVLRLPLTPEEFWGKFLPWTGRIALVFGREGDGLHNDEIEICNAFITIPANPRYPVLNLSHAVTVVLYEMFKKIPGYFPNLREPVSPENFQILIRTLDQLVSASGYPVHKHAKAVLTLKRVLSRSQISETEFYKLMGIMKYLGKLHRLDFKEIDSENLY
ncbi:MAG TPA: RNA methyltransferase [Thermoplasmataceae archaeon]|nr:RNA methyltransferase [Thermoplasmatales archaeon AK]HLH85516.1 RNA methyltransferase [Thermoplasmataceae archaeon]